MENYGSRHNNLPPPEVASAIPCRYFPACRYGTACLFQHPTGPYFQGPLPPPAQYPTSYEQMPPQPYAPTYYPVSQPSFPPPMNGQHPMAPPQGPPVHGPSPSEMMSPPPQGHFSPNGAPAMPPYGPISPVVYTHPGQAPLPMTIPPLPPLHHQPPPPVPQSPSAAFNPSSPPPQQAAFVLQQNSGHYPPVNGNGSVGYPEVNGAVMKSPQLDPQPEPSVPARDGSGARRGTARRGSFASRKPTPPCVFFPTGRCKNGYVDAVHNYILFYSEYASALTVGSPMSCRRKAPRSIHPSIHPGEVRRAAVGTSMAMVLQPLTKNWATCRFRM
jgi:hypothetical protein